VYRTISQLVSLGIAMSENELPEWRRVLDQLDRQIAHRDFHNGARHQLMWWLSARRLKRSADYIFEIYYRATFLQIEQHFRETSEEQSSSRILEGQELETQYDSELGSVYWFLMGCAFENIVKGVCVSRHPELVLDTGTFDKRLTTHDLVKLSQLAGIELSAEEISFFRILSKYVMWQGRYPLPRNRDALIPRKIKTGEPESEGIGFRGRDSQIQANALYAKVSGILEQERQIRLAREQREQDV
jgi:hypothetical protein